MKAHCDICHENFKSEEALAMHSGAKHKTQVNQETEKSNKGFWAFVAIIMIVFIGAYFYLSPGKASGNAVSENIQKITLGFKDYSYYPRTINAKIGIPVEITLDSSVGGCFRNFVIKDLGVSKFSSGTGDKIRFTPNKKGSFKFSCSMGMASGTIVVE